MWFLRRMMKVQWTAKTSNEIILQRENETRTLIKDKGKDNHIFWTYTERTD
jgi:hypothetical protein